MKRSISVALGVLSVAALSVALLAREDTPGGDENLRLRLENDRVKVLERTLRPGEREMEHAHPAHLIVVVQGGKVRDHGADGKVAEIEVKAGDVVFREARTHWSENIGETDIRVLVLELKTGAQEGAQDGSSTTPSSAFGSP